MIVDPVLLLAFVPAVLALVLTPGADMMFALAQGLRGGRRAAVAASAGIGLGAFINAAQRLVDFGDLFEGTGFVALGGGRADADGFQVGALLLTYPSQ